VPALIEALKDDDYIVRQYAVEALGRIGPKAASAVPGIRAALNDEYPDVREAAAKALREIVGDSL